MSNAKTERNPRGSGRKAGKRKKEYELALQDFLMNGGSVAQVAEKYKIDRAGLHRLIKSTNETALKEIGTNDLRAVAVESQKAVVEGLRNIEVLKKSTNPIHNALADNIIEKIHETNLTLARRIQIIGSGLLDDLDKNITALRDKDKMTMKNISTALMNLETANRIMGIPKMPTTQINIQNNQGVIASQQDSPAKVIFEISTPDIIEGETEDD